MSCTVCTINCVSFQTPVPMDPVTILLGGALIISSLLLLLTANKKKMEIARRVDKIPGPKRYPVLGTDYPLLFAKTKGEKLCGRSLNHSRMHVVVIRI